MVVDMGGDMIENMVEVMHSGLPHLLKLWFGMNKGILPVRYFCSNKFCFFISVEFHRVHKTVTKLM